VFHRCLAHSTLSKCESACASDKTCGGFSFNEHDSMHVEGSCLFHEQVEAVYKQFGVISWHTVYYGLACLFVLYIFQFQMKKILPKSLKIISNLGPLCIVVTSVIIVMTETAGDLDHYTANCPKGKTCTSRSYNPQKDFMKSWDVKVIGMICEEGGLACLPDFTTPFSLHFCPENGHEECAAGDGKEEYLKLRDMSALIVPAISVALIGYMESMTIAKTVAKLRAKINDGGSFKLKIDPSQELVALGMCNVAVSFLRGYPVTGSFSRTAVNGDSGARSPFASMTCALVVGGALVLLTNYLKYLPKVVLATIVLISIVKLVDVEEALYLFRVCKRDFVVFMIIFLSTIFLGVEDALLIGILSNWALYLSHANKTQVTVLGRRKGDTSGNFVDVLATGVQDSENHVVVLKLFTDICFSNASSLKQTIEDATNAVPDTTTIVMDCANVNDLDGSGLHALGAITSELVAANRRLVIGGMPRHCRKVMELATKHKEELQAGAGRWDPTNRTEEQIEVIETAGPDGQTKPPALVCFASVDAAVRHGTYIASQVSVSAADVVRLSAAAAHAPAAPAPGRRMHPHLPLLRALRAFVRFGKLNAKHVLSGCRLAALPWLRLARAPKDRSCSPCRRPTRSRRCRARRGGLRQTGRCNEDEVRGWGSSSGTQASHRMINLVYPKDQPMRPIPIPGWMPDPGRRRRPLYHISLPS
jgi:MFS superfamily sulfate permease-like transporter